MPRTTNRANKPPLGTLIGKRLKEMDKQQKWLAQEARISKTYLCSIMNGRAKIGRASCRERVLIQV